jgi:glycosyltransferase involved in cell wall biosynthesis
MGGNARLESYSKGIIVKLLVISHTAHYLTPDGKIAGWAPTVAELDNLTDIFDSITHIACLHKGLEPPASVLEYKSGKVKFVPIKPFGGKGVIKKLLILTQAFRNLKTVRKELKNADYFFFRAPTSIGLYMIPYLTLSKKKKGWYKYAGNWIQKNAPLSYRIQKWLLLNQSREITINGNWENQPINCLSFENPCLTDDNRKEGLKHIAAKRFNHPLKLCFVGELSKEKGIYRIFEAIKQYNNPSIFSSLEVVGDGIEKQQISELAGVLPIPVKIHGALTREKLFDIYKQSDFIVLPSDSEGFPKVIAEAANFGCIPIVSDVSAIGQYINDTNGFLWNHNKKSFNDFFTTIDFTDSLVLKNQSIAAYNMASSFTYGNYVNKLKKYILNKSE